MMKIKKITMKKIVSLILLVSLYASAQEYKGNIESVNLNGLHKIALTPEAISDANNSFSRFRIYDSQNSEVPFAIYEENLSESNQKNFPIFQKNVIDTVSTSIIILNENKQNLDGLYLKIANTNVSKQYNIYGSNDEKKWFGLVNNQSVSGLSTENGTWVERLFSFPVNDYKFLKFEFLDKKSLPINILEVNLYANHKLEKEFIELKNCSQERSFNKETKQTEIVFTFDKPQLINKLRFDISAPNFYLREAVILLEKTKRRKKRNISYQENYMSFELNSKNVNQFNIRNLFTKSFTLVIDNHDNPELTLNSIQLFQNQTYLIADLKQNEIYSLIIDSKFKEPNYDLALSGIDLNKNYPTTQVLNIAKIKTQAKEEVNKSFWQTSAFMWICIILAVITLGFFSVSMIKDLGKEK